MTEPCIDQSVENKHEWRASLLIKMGVEDLNSVPHACTVSALTQRATSQTLNLPPPPTGAPVFLVEPRDLTVRSGEDVELRCQATGEPVPTIEWLRAGRPLQAGQRLRTLPDGSLWLGHVEAGDAGAYECVAHNPLGSATARALLAVRGEESPCLGLHRVWWICPAWQLPSSPLN